MIRSYRGVHPQIHPTAFIEESAQVIGDVHIGAESSVWFNATVRGDVFYIRIGERTNVQDGSVIHVAAGSLLTPGTKVPPRSLVMGSPARVKRPLTGEEVAGLDIFWKNYIEYTRHYLNEVNGK